MKKAMISVIVPVYNTEQYLDVCVQSIVDQTYSNLEIILVNDGSSDSSPEICEKWVAKDARVQVIHKQNGGAASARNTGLNIAKGQYIGFVDSDDYIAEDMFESLITAIVASDIGIADCGVIHVSMDGNISGGETRLLKELNTEQAINAIFLMEIDTSVCCKLYKRSVFNGLRFPEGETNEEFPLLIPSVVASNGIVQIAECKYYYRYREGSVTKVKIPDTKVLMKNFEVIEEHLKDYSLQIKSFGYFMAHYSLSHCLQLEKNYESLTLELRSDYRKYREILWKNMITYLISYHSRFKNKLLYILVLTKLLRPLYKVFYRDHL